MSKLNPTIARVTKRIIERSKPGRQAYLDLMDREADRAPERTQISCSNLAHAFAGALEDQAAMKADRGSNIGIVTAYNDMLSRSEEHTSELQSLMRISYAVFCLKKKNKTTTNTR